MQTLSERAIELCDKFNIDPQIVNDYLTLPDKHSGDYYYNPMCGSGKTVGLAIALKECENLRIAYCASSHARLTEFEELCDELELNPLHIWRVEEIFSLPESSQKVILLTNSMLLQIPAYFLNDQCGKDDSTRRILVIDEMPSILNKVFYRFQDLSVIADYFDTNQGIKKGKENKLYNIVNRSFESKCIQVVSDVAINTNKFVGNDGKLQGFNVNAKLFFIKYLMDIHKNVDFDSLDFIELEKSRSRMIPPSQVYLDRFDKTLILDATADLYGELLNLEQLAESPYKNYSDYIQEIKNLRDINPLPDSIESKISMIQVFRQIFDSIYEILPKDADTYIVTYNDALYNKSGENKSVREDVIEYLKTKFCDEEGTPHVNTSDPNYIVCWRDFAGTGPKTYIANYNRNRGTNHFRSCKYVVLIGEFRLRSNDLSSLINDNDLQGSWEELSLKYSVADAIQELSRGCIRDRNKNNKELIYLLGSDEWVKAISSYLNQEITAPIFESHLDKIKNSLRKYWASNENNKRKSSYLKLIELILQDENPGSIIPGSPSGYIWWSEIKKEIDLGNLPQRLYEDNRIRSYFEEIGYDYSLYDESK